MKVNVENWTLKQSDHLWFEETLADDYVFDDACDGCGEQMIEIAKVTNENSSIGLTTGLCPSCGFVKRTNNLAYAKYSEHFKRRWLSGSNSEISDQQVFAEDTYVFDQLRPYLPHKSKVSILDAGCGIGQRLISFQKNNYQIYGFDPSEHRTEIASRSLPNIEVNTAEYYLADTEQSFDVIYFFNVLQFTADPFAIIELAAQRLNHDGLLYLCVGEFYSDTNYAHFAHLGIIRSFLSFYCLQELFNRLGLTAIKVANSPLEIILKKTGGNREISGLLSDKHKKVTIRTIEHYIKRTLPYWRLGIFGQSEIKYQGRSLTLRNRQEWAIKTPVEFVHSNEYLPLLLK